MQESHTSASQSITIRLRMEHSPGLFAQAATIIGAEGGNIGAIDIVRIEQSSIIRDVTVDTTGEAHADAIVNALNTLPNTKVLHISDRVFVMHLGGKIEVTNKKSKILIRLSMTNTNQIVKNRTNSSNLAPIKLIVMNNGKYIETSANQKFEHKQKQK